MQTNKRNVTIGVLVATFLAAIEVTIVSTAMPTIVSDLGGLTLISWVYAVYLLTSAVTTPIFGKLSDLFGRKVIFTAGTVIFLLGSILSGFSRTMDQLIAFRALQGIGAGAVLPVTFTIIGDIYPMEQRAKVQGLISSMWGISGIIGPLVGGFFVDYLSWHWIFFINIPFGLVSMALIWLYLHESFEKKKRHIDVWGALTFAIAATALLYALQRGEQDQSWTSPLMLALFAAAVVFTGVFIAIQARSPEPMIPLKLFKNRAVAVSNMAGLLTSAVLIGLNAYLPMWMQGVLGVGATSSGLTLAPMSIGWPLGAMLCGRLLVRYGPKLTALLGMTCIVAGSLWLAFAGIETPQAVLVAIMFVIGLGFGFSMTVFTVAVQSAVDWNMRGAATATYTFFRTLGQTVGIAVFGAMLNTAITTELKARADAGGVTQDMMNKLLNPESAAELPAAVVRLMREVLVAGLHHIFLVSVFVAAAAWLLTYTLPRAKAAAKAREPQLRRS